MGDCHMSFVVDEDLRDDVVEVHSPSSVYSNDDDFESPPPPSPPPAADREEPAAAVSAPAVPSGLPPKPTPTLSVPLFILKLLAGDKRGVPSPPWSSWRAISVFQTCGPPPPPPSATALPPRVVCDSRELPAQLPVIMPSVCGCLSSLWLQVDSSGLQLDPERDALMPAPAGGDVADKVEWALRSIVDGGVAGVEAALVMWNLFIVHGMMLLEEEVKVGIGRKIIETAMRNMNAISKVFVPRFLSQCASLRALRAICKINEAIAIYRCVNHCVRSAMTLAGWPGWGRRPLPTAL